MKEKINLVDRKRVERQKKNRLKKIQQAYYLEKPHFFDRKEGFSDVEEEKEAYLTEENAKILGKILTFIERVDQSFEEGLKKE